MLFPVRGMLAQGCGCEFLDDFSTHAHTGSYACAQSLGVKKKRKEKQIFLEAF